LEDEFVREEKKRCPLKFRASPWHAVNQGSFRKYSGNLVAPLIVTARAAKSVVLNRLSERQRE
jgi:hypothetical protein